MMEEDQKMPPLATTTTVKVIRILKILIKDEPTDSARFISFSTESLIDRDRFLCSRVALATVIFDAIFF